MIDYPYTDRDLLETREHYFYSTLQGPEFFDAWRDARRATLDILPIGDVSRAKRPDATGYPAPGQDAIRTDALLDALEADPDAGWLERLVQRFEVTKRLYDSYDGRLRKPHGDCRDLRPYARLAGLLAGDVAASGDLKHLSTLLKLNDLLCSQPPARRCGVAALLRHSLTVELAAVDTLLTRQESARDD